MRAGSHRGLALIQLPLLNEGRQANEQTMKEEERRTRLAEKKQSGEGERWSGVDIFSQREEKEVCSQGFIPVGYI